MTAVWMIQCACIALLIAVAALGFESAAKYAGRPLRWIWSAALLMTVVLTLLLPWRTESSAPNNVIVFGVAATAPAPQATSLSKIGDALTAAQHALQSIAHVVASPSRMLINAVEHAPASNSVWLTAFWIGATAVVAIAMLCVYASFRSSRKLWPLASLHSIVVRISPTTGPLVIGLTNAEIVVPQWLLARDADEQRMVLDHEQEHLRARDPLLLALACCAVVILPWNPAVWWMLARLRLAVELDCDRRLLRRGISVRSYGALLIDLTGHRSGLRFAVPAFACSTSHLERRLVAMTSKRPRHVVFRTIALSAIGALAVVAACESKLPTSADASAAKTAKAKDTVPSVKLAVDSTVNVPSSTGTVLLKKQMAELEMRKGVKVAPTVVLRKTNANDTISLEEKQAVEMKAMLRAKTMIRGENIVQGTPLFKTKDTVSVQNVPHLLQLKREDGSSASMQGSAIRVEGVRLTDAEVTGGAGTLRADTLIVNGKPTGPFRIRGKLAGDPLFIVDGVVVSDTEMRKLLPEQVESIEVRKNNPAAPGLEARAASGEVIITTKAAKRKN